MVWDVFPLWILRRRLHLRGCLSLLLPSIHLHPPAMLALALLSSSSTPTLSSSTSDSATSNLTPSSSAHYDPFHVNPLPIHTHEMSSHALLVMNNLSVVEAFFEGVREVLDGSGHTDDN